MCIEYKRLYIDNQYFPPPSQCYLSSKAVARAFTTLGRRPIDILVGYFDVASFTMDTTDQDTKRLATIAISKGLAGKKKLTFAH